MSFKLGLNRIQEAIVVALMIVFVFALYSNIELTYKIGIAFMVFTLILLSTVASEVLKELDEKIKQKS
jgi:hypothetical protein